MPKNLTTLFMDDPQLLCLMKEVLSFLRKCEQQIVGTPKTARQMELIGKGKVQAKSFVKSIRDSFSHIYILEKTLHLIRFCLLCSRLFNSTNWIAKPIDNFSV